MGGGRRPEWSRTGSWSPAGPGSSASTWSATCSSAASRWRASTSRRSTTRTAATGSRSTAATSATAPPSTRAMARRRRGRALRRRAAALPAAGHLHDRRRGARAIVLEAARRHGVERVVHISSTAVYGIPDHHPLLEDDRLDGVGPYGQAKIQAEMVCLEYRAQGPDRADPAAEVVHRAGAARRLRAALRLGARRAQLPDARQRRQPLPVARRRGPVRRDLPLPDAARARRRTTRSTSARRVHARCARTTRRCSTRPATASGSSASRPRRPSGAARARDARLSPLYKWVYETAVKDSFVSIEKAERVLGFAPQLLEPGCARCATSPGTCEHRDRFAGQSGVTHRVPWKQGALGVRPKRFF